MNIAWRRMVGVGGAALVVLGAFMWVLVPKQGSAPPPAATTLHRTVVQEREQPKPIGDDDQDGLANWEEALRRTDSQNPDSDGDGTGDKDELEAGRDPLKKGPDDTAPGTRAQELTQARIEELLPTRAPLRQEAALEPPEQTPPRTPRAAAETPAVNPELRVFGNALGAALALITNDSFAQNERALIAQAAPSRDGAALPALAPLAESYERVASNLQAVAAPSEGTVLLGNLKDGYARLGHALLELSRSGAELKIQSERWTEYSASVIGVGKALNEAIGFFMERGAVFNADDPGRIFVMSSK